MKILKEANDSKEATFNPFRDVQMKDLIQDTTPEEAKIESLDESLFEAVANPFELKGPEVNQQGRSRYGTCFKRTGHPSIYGIIGLDPDSGEIRFQALDHEFGNIWKTDIQTMTQYFEDGTFHEATDDDIRKAYEYDD